MCKWSVVLKVFGEGIFCYLELLKGLISMKWGKLIFDESARKNIYLDQKKMGQEIEKAP